MKKPTDFSLFPVKPTEKFPMGAGSGALAERSIVTIGLYWFCSQRPGLTGEFGVRQGSRSATRSLFGLLVYSPCIWTAGAFYVKFETTESTNHQRPE